MIVTETMYNTPAKLIMCAVTLDLELLKDQVLLLELPTNIS